MAEIIRGDGSRVSVGKSPRERVDVIYEEKGECSPQKQDGPGIRIYCQSPVSTKVIADQRFQNSPVALASYMQMCMGCWMCPERLKSKAAT